MQLKDEFSTQAIGKKVAEICEPPLIIYLSGELGAGKTTFAKGFIRALGYSERVKSPTFSLVETYLFKDLAVYHFDLYRIVDPVELEFIGIRDLSAEKDAICLIEWPKQGGKSTPPPDLILNFEHSGDYRILKMTPESAKGQLIMGKL